MEKQQIIDLWRLSFNDSEEFISLYFDRVYKEENTLVIEKNGQIVSALQMIPYTMSYYGTEISVAYIYGACTLPSMRGKGLMRELLHNAFEEMQRRSVALTVLIPDEDWLFDYYRKSGFTEAFDCTENEYARPEVPVYAPEITVMPPNVPSVDQLYDYFNRKIRERKCCMLHTKEDFITILRDLELDGGRMLTALNEQEETIGMAFVMPPQSGSEQPSDVLQKQVYVKEFLYDDDRVASLLLQESTLQFNVDKAIYRIPPMVPASRPFGMARVIDTKRLMHHWLSAHKESALTEQSLKEMDIRTFTNIVMGYPNRESYMSLMLD